MNNCQWLAWDSGVLGVKVARVTAARCATDELQAILTTLAHQGARLVYWAVAHDCLQSQQAAAALNGFLADHKVTYLCHLHNARSGAELPYVIEEYQAELPDDRLIELAFSSGSYSRFRTDKRLTQAQFEAVYRAWITNSTNKQIAEKVLVINIDNQLAGMITLGEKQGRGDIGLLAVHQHFQGKKIGTALVTAAQRYFFKRYQWSQVVTQKDNLPACSLYERCGYHIEKIENFYHFWL